MSRIIGRGPSAEEQVAHVELNRPLGSSSSLSAASASSHYPPPLQSTAPDMDGYGRSSAATNGYPPRPYSPSSSSSSAVHPPNPYFTSGSSTVYPYAAAPYPPPSPPPFPPGHPGTAVTSHGPPPGRKKSFLARVPWFTVAVTIACIIVFIVTMGVNDCPGHYHGSQQCVFKFLGIFSFEPLNINPMLGPTSKTLLNMGALNTNLVVYYGQGWRLITAMWLHAGVIHLGSNLVALGFLGWRLEMDFGFVRIAIVYLLSGFASAVFSALFLGDSVSVGASGAVFGLVGATLAELLVNWGLYQNRVQALVTLLLLIIINLAIGLLPYVDNFAHIGGLLAGTLLGFALLLKPQRQWVDPNDPDAIQEAATAAELDLGGVPVTKKYSQCQWWTRILSAVLFIAWLTTILILLFTGSDVSESCPWCRYLSCIPTDYWTCSTKPPNTEGAGPLCQVVKFPNGTGAIRCPNQSVSTFNNLTSYTGDGLRVLCTETCA